MIGSYFDITYFPFGELNDRFDHFIIFKEGFLISVIVR